MPIMYKLIKSPKMRPLFEMKCPDLIRELIKCLQMENENVAFISVVNRAGKLHNFTIKLSPVPGNVFILQHVNSFSPCIR